MLATGMPIMNAVSSSLVAVHLAVRSLRGEFSGQPCAYYKAEIERVSRGR